MIGNDTEFARYLGVNKSSVSRARKAGRLVLTADGRVEFEASAARWHETSGGRTDVAARHAAKRGADIPSPKHVQKNAPAARATATAGEDEITSGETRASAKAALLHYENTMLKLQITLRRGTRLERRAVAQEAGNIGAILRSGVDRLIDQTAPRLAAADDDMTRRRVIEAEVDRLRRVFRREIPRAMRRMRESGKKAAASA